MDGVHNRWKNCNGGVSSSSKIAFNIKPVKQHIKSVMKEKKTKEDLVKILEDQLVVIENKAAAQGWVEQLRQDCLACLAKLWKQIRIEERKWKQFLKVKWLKEGGQKFQVFPHYA